MYIYIYIYTCMYVYIYISIIHRLYIYRDILLQYGGRAGRGERERDRERERERNISQQLICGFQQACATRVKLLLLFGGAQRLHPHRSSVPHMRTCFYIVREPVNNSNNNTNSKKQTCSPRAHSSEHPLKHALLQTE